MDTLNNTLNTAPDLPSQGDPVEAIINKWREPFIRAVLRITSVVGLLATIAGVLSVDSVGVASLYVGAYAILLGITLIPTPYWVRAGVFLAVLYALGVVELFYLGIIGDANVFFLPFAIMATLLFSPRAGIRATTLTLLTLIVVGWLMLAGRITPWYPTAVKGALSDWLSAGAVFTLFSAMLIAALRLLQSELRHVQEQHLNALSGLKNQESTLEMQVSDRTRDLEYGNLQLETAARIAREITTIRDLNLLLTNVVNLISQRFGYYHAGVFLLDEYNEYAVLAAANSEGGRRMLERGHRLKVGATGIVGYVTQMGTARIALDVGQDAVYFDNPDLPNTHSELALPIVASGQILGALDVQSTEEQAFRESDIKILQLLADQLAVAIQNARLFQESQASLEAVRQAYAEASREAWQKFLKSEEQIGFVATQGTLQPTPTSQWNDSLVKAVESGDLRVDENEPVVNIPVKIRGQAIGAIRLRKQDNSGAWTKEETALALAFSDQLSSALEAARLYRDAQTRAVRESIASDISSRISTSPYMENVMRDTVSELGQALGQVSVTFQMIAEPNPDNLAIGPDGSGNGNGAGRSDSAKQAKE